MIKLSVIVPVYNVERFLPRCLDSLLRQGVEDGEYEVICVNDGSPDGCAAILADYEHKHPGIFKVIAQENQGLGCARNTGMKMAKGEWLTFVDSDDYLVDGAYRYLLDHFCDEEVDVLHYGYVFAYTDGKSLYDHDALPEGKISYDGDGAELYNRIPLPYVWSKLYRRTFLEKNRVCFEPVFLEDDTFNFEVFLHSPHLRVVTSNIYRYEQGNVNSQMTIVDKEAVKRQLQMLLPVIEKVIQYMQEGDGRLAIGARRTLNIYLRHYYNKMLKGRLKRQEWKTYSQLLKEHPIHRVDVSSESSRLGRAIAHLKNWSGESYIVYCLTEKLLNKVFTPIMRPRIIASYTQANS